MQYPVTPALPPRFGSFDLYHSYKVAVNEPEPYLHADVYRRKYEMYKGHHEQAVIRDSHDQRYFVIKEHPEHVKYHGEGEHHGEHHEGDRH